MEDRPVYIYGLSEPEALWNIRYVGKVLARPGEGPQQAIERRLQWHVYECHKKTNRTRRHNWLRSLGERKPSWQLLDIGDDQTWEALERFHIASHRGAGFDLLNASDGGDGIGGYIATPEHRHKISRALKGRTQSKEWAARRASAWTGRKHSPESIAKMSAAKKGKPSPLKDQKRPPHIAQAVGAAHKGLKWTAEAIAKREATKAAKRANGEYPSRKGPPAEKGVERRGRTPVTHCVHGHAYTPENSYVNPKGRRTCRICREASWRRARSLRPKKPHTYANHARGSRHPRTHLTDDSVRDIRQLYASGWTQRALANTYAVSMSCINHIVARRCWQHVT